MREIARNSKRTDGVVTQKAAGADAAGEELPAAGADSRVGMKSKKKKLTDNVQIPEAGCKREPKASLANAGSSASASAEDMDITPTTDTVMAVALVPYSGNAANSEGLLDGLISSHQSRTDEQHEVMHTEIVKKKADIIDRFRSLDIFALSWVEHNMAGRAFAATTNLE
jgi:hypothetical protein